MSAPVIYKILPPIAFHKVAIGTSLTYKDFYSYIIERDIDMLPKRSTPVDQTLESKSIRSQLSVAIFIAPRNLLGARKSLI